MMKSRTQSKEIPMTIKVDWEADPAKIRTATRIPDIFTPRDYGIVASIYALIIAAGLFIGFIS